ncbi:MAG TPA: hypothetical protein PK719_05305 [Bacteroidales bacterium]|jgi:hypothetical protein|nr:hypothetical protein [Bacteroidales bacterium]OQB61602.1 MAG: hypothetical protein BWX96_01705 [Bacteroidetes bacterium ADurb.Bin145]HOU01460.1 hypothetical protein [Bacteroidales bacterium]HQG63051.1 hypothetical protein [Bacteroidales bacterium]HQK68941.1 hypothetical protein [Bacteroidales bacterium]
MATDTDKKKQPGIAILIVEILILAFLVYYTIMAMLAPVIKRDALETEFGFIQDDKKENNRDFTTDSAYLSLLKQKSYLESRVIMANTDSIYLTISLPDSTVNLEISGVSVHTAPIKHYELSRIIKKGNEYVISSFLSRPFTIQKDYSSIPKEPLMIKMAPKDTSEYQPDIIPDTADFEPVNYIMEMDNGIRLFIYQDENKLNPGDHFHRITFDFRYRLAAFIETLRSVLVFKVPDYHPYIKIRLPRSDAKIIYRAMPKNGQVALFR